MENGVWRTVGGRRIFIKEGQDLETAMKESGKFGGSEKSNSSNQLTKKDKEKIYNQLKDTYIIKNCEDWRIQTKKDDRYEHIYMVKVYSEEEDMSEIYHFNEITKKITYK